MANTSVFHIRLALPSDADTIADFNARMAIETENTTLPPESSRRSRAGSRGNS
jgi:hypothetical protein